MRRLLPLLALIGILLTLFAVPAMAAEEEHAEEEKVEVTTDVTPAVVQDLFIAEEPEVPAWTYRFMVPGLIALTLLAVVGTSVQYFVKVVRPRYQPAE